MVNVWQQVPPAERWCVLEENSAFMITVNIFMNAYAALNLFYL